MSASFRVIRPKDDDYTLACETCHEQRGELMVIDGRYIGKCCAPKAESPDPGPGALQRLRLVKKQVA